MKIGIITFHAAFNYGSMLQAYALQTYLKSMGHTGVIINFRTMKQKMTYSPPIYFGSFIKALSSVKRLFLNPASIKGLNRKWNLFNIFLDKYLYLTKEYNTEDQLQNEHWNFDAIITGSDQIWNTQAFDFSEVYFATFAPEIKKIAYAPSMGPHPEHLNDIYLKSLLKDFSAISVREKKTADYLQKKRVVDNVRLVVDPTMLLSAKDYDILFDKTPLIQKPYIFYYTPGHVREEFLKIADEIGVALDMKVVYDTKYSGLIMSKYKNFYSYPEVGPSEFLNLIYNADFVVGASFHLIVFAILFKKNFYCINGDVDSRMNNLLTQLKLTDRIICVSDPLKKYLVDVDYTSADIALNELRKQSYEYLYKNLVL